MELGSTEKLIINQLIDHEVFTSTPEPQTTNKKRQAIEAFKQAYKQRRVHDFFEELIGEQPFNYGNNLLLLMGSGNLTSAQKHVFLATLRAVISSPQMDGLDSDMVIDSQSIIQQVHSEVFELNETEIYAIINDLFVERFGLFTPDYPEGNEQSQSEIMDPFWDINPDFISITHEFIAYISHSSDEQQVSIRHEINRELLNRRFISPQTSGRLWRGVQENKEQLMSDWKPLERFRLECGDDYAILLDGQQKKSEAKPLIVAIAYANLLHNRILKTDLSAETRKVAKEIFPGRTINPSDVKKCLIDNALVLDKGDYYQRTPVASRFQAVKNIDAETFE